MRTSITGVPGGPVVRGWETSCAAGRLRVLPGVPGPVSSTFRPVGNDQLETAAEQGRVHGDPLALQYRLAQVQHDLPEQHGDRERVRHDPAAGPVTAGS